MTELELGQATIVYDHPEEGRTEETVDNEKLVYARDHWMVATGTDERGNDLMRQIPKERVHYVERNVQRFEEQAATIKRRVESVARDLQEKLPVGGRQRGRERPREERGEPVRIETREES